MNSKVKNKNDGKFVDNTLIMMKTMFVGTKQVFKNLDELYMVIIPSCIYIYLYGYTFNHLKFLHAHIPFFMDRVRCLKWQRWGNEANGLILLIIFFLIILFAYGAREINKKSKIVEAFKSSGMKNAIGETPKVISIKKGKENEIQVTVLSNGVTKDQIKSGQKSFSGMFGYDIEDIIDGKNKKEFILSLNSKVIPRKILYSDIENKLEAGKVFIGMSQSGEINEEISNLPHLLVAGTTGGGKSYFFRQALVGILQRNKHIQMYLLDLKHGVELERFMMTPNVKTAFEISDCLKVLHAVHAQMFERFKYIKKMKKEKIEITKDPFDLIIVGIDEASLLFKKNSNDDPNWSEKSEARRLVDDISKLGRSASIHLIIGTQKITKDTLTTEAQENITGRLCFPMNTLQGSNIVLGNKKAMDLPDIKGRAIWHNKRVYKEVQVPLIETIDAEKRILKIANEYRSAIRKNKQEMLTNEKFERNKQKRIGYGNSTGI